MGIFPNICLVNVCIHFACVCTILLYSKTFLNLNCYSRFRNVCYCKEAIYRKEAIHLGSAS